MCRHACPVSTTTGKESWIPQAKMDQLNQLRKGQVTWSQESTASLWACTGCRQCTTYCEHGNEPGLVLLSGRAEATERGVGHPALADYPDRFRNRDERLVKQARERLPADRFAEDGVVGFWPGCDAIDKAVEEVNVTLDVFDSIGADHVRIVDASQACAGYPLLAAGYPDMFRWHAEKVAAAIKPFRTVVVNCSACVYALRSMYPAEGISIQTEILALSEFLAQAAARIEQPAKKKMVYYHDPCYLARYAGVTDAPRRVLSRFAEVREFPWSGTDTECCGGAGVLPKTMPDVADDMARRRLKHIANRGGGIVVTSCATCSFMLKRNAPAGVEVADLPTAVAKLSGSSSDD
jgi:Fe-S oxidoreductase